MSMERICAALKPLSIPVTAFKGDASKPVYAVVYEYLERPELRADNAEVLTGHYAQIDFIAKKNIGGLVTQAERLLSAAGFVRQNRRAEYEPQSNTYRYMLRVSIITDYEEGQ